MTVTIPILRDHDHRAPPVGTLEARDSALYFRFRAGAGLTKEELFAVFGNVGFRVLEVEVPAAGPPRIIAGQILEWSMSPYDSVVAEILRAPPTFGWSP